MSSSELITAILTAIADMKIYVASGQYESLSIKAREQEVVTERLQNVLCREKLASSDLRHVLQTLDTFREAWPGFQPLCARVHKTELEAMIEHAEEAIVEIRNGIALLPAAQ